MNDQRFDIKSSIVVLWRLGFTDTHWRFLGTFQELWLLEVDDSDEVKQGDLVKVEEKVVEVEKEEVEE